MWSKMIRNRASKRRSIKIKANSKRCEKLSKLDRCSCDWTLKIIAGDEAMIWFEIRRSRLIRNLKAGGQERARTMWRRTLINKTPT